MERTRGEEELLEAIWSAEERNDPNLPTVERLAHVPVDGATLERMTSEGLISRDGERILLTSLGRELAGSIIRRHRLAERLLHDVLAMNIDEAETGACEFEHLLAPGVTESICTLLGHPRFCPHGTAIPEGSCCRETRTQVASLVFPLTELAPGETARITYINTSHHPRLLKLMSFGVSPGARIKLLQKYPSYILGSGDTEVALEDTVAQDIYVRRDR